MSATASDGKGNEASQSVSIVVTTADTVSVPSTLTVSEDAGNVEVSITTTQAFGKSIAFNITYCGAATGANAPADGDYGNDQVTSISFGPADTLKPSTSLLLMILWLKLMKPLPSPSLWPIAVHFLMALYWVILPLPSLSLMMTHSPPTGR